MDNDRHHTGGRASVHSRGSAHSLGSGWLVVDVGDTHGGEALFVDQESFSGSYLRSEWQCLAVQKGGARSLSGPGSGRVEQGGRGVVLGCAPALRCVECNAAQDLSVGECL